MSGNDLSPTLEEVLRDHRERNEDLVLSLTDGHDGKVYCPIYGSPKKLKKKLRRKFERVKKDNLERWKKDCDDAVSQHKLFVDDPGKLRSMLDTFVANTTNVIRSIESNLSYENNGILMDISPSLDSIYFECGEISKIYIWMKNVLCDIQIQAIGMGLISKDALPSVLYEYKDTLNVFRYSSAELIPRIIEIDLYIDTASCLHRAGAIVEAMQFLRAYVASCWLRWTRKLESDNTHLYFEATKAICEILVENKIANHAQRPFFSAKRLHLIERELGIHSYNSRHMKCGNCGCDMRHAVLRKCVGCCRSWYCSTECQKAAWKDHKKCCGNKWRQEQIVTRVGKEVIERQLEKSGHYVVVSEQSHDFIGADVVVFLKDPTTGEIFDALTDRPVSFKPKTITVAKETGDSDAAEDTAVGELSTQEIFLEENGKLSSLLSVSI